MMFLIFITLYFFTLLVPRVMKPEDMEILKLIENKSGIRMSFLRRLFGRFV